MTTHKHTSDAALADLAPNDEVGVPDHMLVTCKCGAIHRRGDETHPEVCEVAGE